MAGPSFHDFEHDRWQVAAHDYARAFVPLTQQAIAPLLDAAGARAGARVLDVACGPGDLAAEAAARGAAVVALDFAEEMVGIARMRHPGLDVRHGDAEALPFDDASFDAVAMAFLLGHLERPDRALAEARRVLAPGGRVAAAWWCAPERAAAFELVLGAVRAHGRTDVPLPAALPFDHFSDPDRLIAALAGAGFERCAVREAPLVWHPFSAEALWDAYARGTARTAALLEAQAPAALPRIREAVLAGAARFADPAGGLIVPMPAWIASGSR